ncbi:MAG: TetR/AcrR family transcriptional regulator [Nannocystaceae bacterium]|nr:TetR/AcrR family transcriptional regulator [Nannocystaceae bacterium]
MGHADMKRAILDVSLKLGTELGEEGLTMRAIARGLGVSATALYQHYESKAAILCELRTSGVEQLNAYLAPAFDDPDPVEQLRRNAELYLRFSREHPWMYQLINETPEDWGTHNDDRRAAAMNSVERTFAALRDCEQRGLLLENVELKAAPLSIWAALHGMALLMASGRVSPDHSRYPSEAHEIVIRRFSDYVLRCFLHI